MLIESKFNNDFFQLANFYQPQIDPVYCSVATSVIILNALYKTSEIPSQKIAEIQRPEHKGVIEFHSFLQSSFFNAKTDKIKQKDIIEYKAKNAKGEYDAGVSLGDFAKILKSYGLKVKKVYANKNDKKSLAKFRADLKKYLADDKKFIALNFDGKILGTKTGGHISPAVAYHEESDSVLILDVALHKNQWYFAPVSKLYDAMNSKDGDKFRGYLIVWR